MRRIVAWLLATVSVLLLLLWAANLPFYSGSSVGSPLAWRMEHGRIKVACSPWGLNESFYIAANSEGLRFAPKWRVYSYNDWMVNIPLWMPVSVCAAG